MKAFGGRQRLMPDELDLTKVERVPGSRADLETITVPDSAATPGPSRRDRSGKRGHAVTALWMTLPLTGWLAVCMATSASAQLTILSCAGVLVLTAVTLVLCRHAPQPHHDSTPTDD